MEPWDGARVRVLAGEAFGAVSPLAGLATPVTMLDVTVSARGELFVPVPEQHNAWLLVLAGELLLGGVGPAGPDEAVGFVRGGGDGLLLQSGDGEALRCFVGMGAPIGVPKQFMGPFAMSTRERLVDAGRRFEAGEMGRLERV